jgi:magnesium chelatase family protein
MLARRLTTILPAMSLAEVLETTRIHRVAGRTGARTALVMTRPFRAPHRIISDAGLIGGGHVPMPGDESLARYGMLLLDERPEFRRHVLEVLRQSIEDGVVTTAHVLVGIMAHTLPNWFKSHACSRLRPTQNLKTGFTCTPANP